MTTRVPVTLPARGWKLLAKSEFWELAENGMLGITLLRRTREPSSDVDHLLKVIRPVVEAVHLASCARGVVVDVRNSPAARNDQGFESAMAVLREAVSARFDHVVLLVSTAVGELQIRRLASEDGTNSFVTRDEEQAIRLARAG